MASWRDRLRDGAAEVFGFTEVEAEATVLRDRLREANQDARMLSRAIEDVSWSSVGSVDQGPYLEPTPATRREDVRLAYLYYVNDPIVGRTVELRTNYAFSKDVDVPQYRDEPQSDPDVDEATDGPGQAAVSRFWTDPFNQKVLFGEEAQRIKETERQLQANIFLLVLPPEEQADDSDEELRTAGAVPDVPTRIADLPQQEIVDVIMHPGNRKIPVFYKRQYTARSYDFQAGSYSPGESKTVYYRDWRFEAPEQWDGRPWGPDPKQIAKGFIYHIASNRTSEMKFGVTETKRYIKWARGLNEYMHSRMNLVQALSQLAMRAKVAGGPKHVQQIAGTLQQLSRVADQLEGSTSDSPWRQQAGQSKTRVAVENAGVDLQPMVADTNSGNAVNDVNTLKSQVAAGSGVPAHHLGGTGDANLATATSMDAPLQRLSESTQRIWRAVYRDLCGYELMRLGLDPTRLSVKMPPVLSWDVGVVSQAVIGLLAAVDPNVSNRELVRWCVGQVLSAMNVENVGELLDDFFPKDWISPMEQTLMIGQAQQAMAAGGAQDPAATDQANAAAIGAADDEASGSPKNTQSFDDAMQQHATAVNRGRRTVGVRQGPGNAIQASQQRAQRRYNSNVSAPSESLTAEQRERAADFVEGLPAELREVGEATLAVLMGDGSAD